MEGKSLTLNLASHNLLFWNQNVGPSDSHNVCIRTYYQIVKHHQSLSWLQGCNCTLYLWYCKWKLYVTSLWQLTRWLSCEKVLKDFLKTYLLEHYLVDESIKFKKSTDRNQIENKKFFENFIKILFRIMLKFQNYLHQIKKVVL